MFALFRAQGKPFGLGFFRQARVIGQIKRLLRRGVALLGQHQPEPFGSAALDSDISIAPGPIFSAQRAFGDYLRLNYGHPWEPRTAEAMATLGKLIGAAGWRV
jgi:hypothetical protein